MQRVNRCLKTKTMETWRIKCDRAVGSDIVDWDQVERSYRLLVIEEVVVHWDEQYLEFKELERDCVEKYFGRDRE